MKVKKYLSVWAMVCAGALTLAGCSDYDNGYNENAIKFQESFKETFGDIDPEQDWNLAERATVTVNTQTESNIKIYALRGNEYSIVGNYEGVSGTRMLGVDIVEGTRALIVSDGRTAQTCAPGDVVVFNAMSTRTTYEGDEVVKVSKLTGPVDDLGDGKIHEQYVYKSEADYGELIEYVPEHGANLNKVTADFSYVSNGPFIIYPYHWETSSYNTIGVYYYDALGRRVDVDIYKIKESNTGQESELMYENYQGVAWDEETAEVYASVDDEWKNDDNKIWPTNWWVTNGVGKNKFHYNGWSTEGASSGIEVPYIEYWFGTSKMTPGSLRREITGLEPNMRYRVEVLTRLWNDNSATIYPTGVDFVVNNATVAIDKDEYGYSKTRTTFTNETGTHAIVYGTSCLEGVADANGKLTVGFDVKQGTSATWLAFKDLTVKKFPWTSTDGKGSFGHVTRGLGIKVDIPVGVKFGMYLKKSDTVTRTNEADNTTYQESKSYQFFSESALNDPTVVGNGIKVDAEGNKIQVEGLNPCYASTFSVGDRMFFGFEDWPNDGWAHGSPTSDFDYNDMVFAVEGIVPTIINEDPETFTWMLACEDLGGTFDRDYNDVVFKVEHVSGQTFAKVTPLAAGGTLASYIFHVPETGSEQCLGEIHQLFGFEPEVSGEYEAHNAGVSRGKEGQTVNITVPENWSMAYYSTNTFGTGSASYHNMGGFEIRTLPKGTEAPQTTNWTEINTLSSGASRIPAPDMGEAPYIICFPYSYIKYSMKYDTPTNNWETETFWAWPQEFMFIDGCYPDFPGWVSDHSKNGTWYENRKNGAPTVNELRIARASSGGLSTLNLVSNTMKATVGNAPNLLSNVIYSGDAPTFTFEWDWNNGNGPETITIDNPETWAPNQAGELTITASKGGQSVSFTLITLKACPLGHDLETVNVVQNSSGYYDVNNYADLLANLTSANVSNGAISYYYIDYKGDEQPLAKDAHLYQAGNRTIIVRQVENGDYAAGETRFTLNIAEAVAKTDPDFGTQTSIIQGGNWTNSSKGSGDRTINMTAGEDLWIGGILNGTTGTYVGTLKSFSTGGTNSTCSQWESKPGEYRVYTDPNVGGTMKVVLHYDGNDQYNAKDITITINTTKTVKFIHNNLALSYVGGSLQMKTVTDDAAWTNFQKWRLISADKGDGFYFLYNVGANKYLRIGETKNDAGNVSGYFVEWVDSPNKDAQQERFLLTSEGYLGSVRRSQYGRYLGSTQSWQDGAVINSPDAQGNAIINWTIQNTASAKKRM